MEQENAAAPRLIELNRRWAPRLTSKLAEAQRPVLSNLKGYLLAATEAAQAKPTTPLPAGQRHHQTNFPPALLNVIHTIAGDRAFQPDLLGQWTAALLNLPIRPPP